MKKLLVGCLFLIAFSSQGQFVMDSFGGTDGATLLRNKIGSKSVDNVTGSPYLDDKFMLSTIAGTENVFSTRYNAYKDEVEISYDNETFVMPKDDRYSSIFNKQSNYKLQLVKYTTEDGENVYGYLIDVFSDDNTGLFRREKITVQQGREAVNSYSQSTPPKYSKKSPEYYLKFNSDKIIPFPSKKKDLLNMYSKHEDKLSSFLKEKKVSFKSEQDLTELTKLLSTLQ